MVCRGRCVDFGAQVLGNLHGHAAHATGRGMDQHFLATLHASVLGQRLPGRQGRCRDSAGLQDTDRFWIERQFGNLGNGFGRVTADDVDEAETFALRERGPCAARTYQRRRASRLKRPAPKATTCNRPPAMAMFLKKWMNWF